jgi:DNA replication protein DnaC
VIFDVSPLVDSMISRNIKPTDESLYATESLTRDKQVSRTMFIYKIGFYIYLGRMHPDKIAQKGWYNIFDEKKPFNDIIKWHPRFGETRIPMPDQLMTILCVKPGYAPWIDDRIKEIEQAASADPKYWDNKSTADREEYDNLLNIRNSAYDVLSSEKVKYFDYVQKRNKAIQVYYDKVEGAVLKKSLQNLKYMDKFTNQQLNIIFGEKNLVYFGRSGTGKTHCCVHTMLSRHLTANAIARKLGQKYTDIKNDTNISGLKSIFITASALLAKEVKAQYETTLKRVETINAKEEIRVLTEEKIFDSLQAVQSRGKELPKSFFETDIQWPLFLSHQEFVSILYNTMLEGNTDFKQMEQRVKIDANDDGNITINRR